MVSSFAVTSSDTRERLLDSAERLFAEHGFDATSTRAIIEDAGGANSAAINYYFGSKEGLLREVLDRVLVALFTEQRDALHELSSKPSGPAPVLATIVEPAVALHRGPRGPVVARLLGHILADPSTDMRTIALSQAALVEADVAAALLRSTPRLSADEARIRFAGVMAVLSFYLVGMFDHVSPDTHPDARSEAALLVAMLAGAVSAAPASVEHRS
jgi:AcrR family transcriptional regulator